LIQYIAQTIDGLKKEGDSYSYDLWIKARALTIRASAFMTSFFTLYRLVKNKQPKSDLEILQTEAAIKDYCAQYRKFVNKVVTPKVHLIEAIYTLFEKIQISMEVC
jgi:glycine cleavage system regulatory protein